eukprot:5488141-Pyramimonas_sp.AAC.1
MEEDDMLLCQYIIRMPLCVMAGTEMTDDGSVMEEDDMLLDTVTSMNTTADTLLSSFSSCGVSQASVGSLSMSMSRNRSSSRKKVAILKSQRGKGLGLDVRVHDGEVRTKPSRTPNMMTPLTRFTGTRGTLRSERESSLTRGGWGGRHRVRLSQKNSSKKLTGLGKVLQNIRMSRLNEDEDDSYT